MSGSPLRNQDQLVAESASITDALRLVLRRVVRLLVGTVSFPALVEILKKIYVEEAEKKLLRNNSKPTKSALALITGLDTRVVSAVVKSDLDSSLKPKNICAESALLDMWANDPFFIDPETKKPAIIPLEGRGRTLQGLVLKSIGRNVTVKTVLDRLIESSNVRIIPGAIERVEMLSQFYSPISSDRAKMTDIALYESSRVLSAVIHNMDSDPEFRVPQQGRWTYRLAPENYLKFRSEARKLLEKQISEGEALLESFEEKNKKPGQLTVGFGWYQWGGHESDEETEA
ncbi:MAG: hypothetical protein GTN86_01885 [Xanthomonadales bacterium]|nr:hypothetical protein [Xanthomonadales bacterium]NIN74034.1 hypothetical protein [Xanthomonadales bacterium]NIO12420.1 hypothetical protein [Xanthomonadales bacterium]NIP11159.1 hypothetical protein [Xanthomonadales bacterium]NIP74665.1 hypothetical protein [Xanthomonadales bacterium]